MVIELYNIYCIGENKSSGEKKGRSLIIIERKIERGIAPSGPLGRDDDWIEMKIIGNHRHPFVLSLDKDLYTDIEIKNFEYEGVNTPDESI